MLLLAFHLILSCFASSLFLFSRSPLSAYPPSVICWYLLVASRSTRPWCRLARNGFDVSLPPLLSHSRAAEEPFATSPLAWGYDDEPVHPEASNRLTLGPASSARSQVALGSDASREPAHRIPTTPSRPATHLQRLALPQIHTRRGPVRRRRDRWRRRARVEVRSGPPERAKVRGR